MPSDRSDDAGHAGNENASAAGARLEAVLDQYLEELAGGGQPDQERYVREHPDLADALRGVFRTLDFVETTSKSLSAGSLEPGQQLGEYRIQREIGRGGMGVVYEAVQTSLGRRVALKILPLSAALTENAQERFLREAATAGRLHHSNIVPVYAVGEEQGVQYYAMQFIEGHSLSQQIKEWREAGASAGDRDCKRTARWGRQIADGLAHAHAQAIVHRDIKPSNLLIDNSDNVWISDFGLARVGAEASLTVTGDIVGTARYMSPEQARGKGPIDHRSDIYSLGATLYELLTGIAAIDGETREEVLNKIAMTEPLPLRQVSRHIPRDLETIVHKCLVKAAGQRYQQAEDVADDLRRFVAGDPIRVRRTSLAVKAWRWAKRHRTALATAAALVILIAAIAGLTLRIRHVRGEQRLEEALQAAVFERDAERATGLIEEAASLGVDSAELHFCKGIIALLGGQQLRAIAPLEQALQRDADHVETCYALAHAHFSIGDALTGQRYFERAEAQEITTGLGWLLRGQCLVEGRSVEALECFNRALALRSDLTPAIEARAYLRGRRLIVDGDRSMLQPMLDDFDAWVTFWAESRRSYWSRASGLMYAAAYAETQDDLQREARLWLEASSADFQRAISMAADMPVELLIRNGAHLRMLGDFEGSAAAFSRAIALDREASGDAHPGFVHHRALVLHAMGELEQALGEIEPVCEAVPAFFPAALQRAILLAELGRIDEAREVALVCAEQQRDYLIGLAMVLGTLDLLGEHEYVRERAAAVVSEVDSGRVTHDAENRVILPVFRYLSGELDASELRQAAGDHPGTWCQCAWVIALHELGRGEREAGRMHLEACLETGVFIYAQHRFACVLVERMNADPRWPVWTVD